MYRRAVENSGPPPLPLLITGVAGVAGYNALAYFQARYPGQVIGIRQQRQLARCRAGHRGLRCRRPPRPGANCSTSFGFAAVLDCAGNCACKPASSIRRWPGESTSKAPRNLADLCARRGARLVHLSIDLVFSGTRGGNHVEDDPTDPVTVYGKTMVAAERLIAERLP